VLEREHVRARQRPCKARERTWQSWRENMRELEREHARRREIKS
jgi:hypothetical protein